MNRSHADRDTSTQRLKIELAYQWSINHWEHCRNDWPHEGICHWPVPAGLVADEVEELLKQRESDQP